MAENQLMESFRRSATYYSSTGFPSAAAAKAAARIIQNVKVFIFNTFLFFKEF
jgi:hypothetical protein